jgi:ATP synthase protein I
METPDDKDDELFSQQIGTKEKRKLKAQKEHMQSVWFGLGMFGMVGWSVSVPTLSGAALGMWLDKAYPQTFSWTLTCLFLGLISGAMIAWHWVTKEDREMNQNNSKENE